jgi:hypothetical protein
MTLLVCPALAGCGQSTSTPETMRTADAGASSMPPPSGDDTPPPGGSPPPATTDAGPGTPGDPPPPDDRPPPSADDTARAERYADADSEAFAASCRCHFMEYGYTTADECMTDAVGGSDPTFVECIAAAFAGRTEFAECAISDTEAFASCTAAETCGSTACEGAEMDCPDADAGWAAVDACYGD